MAQILIAGDFFEGCKVPVPEADIVAGGVFNVLASSDAAACSSSLGRDCQVDAVSDSGDFTSFTNSTWLSAIGDAYSIWEAVSADEVGSNVSESLSR